MRTAARFATELLLLGLLADVLLVAVVWIVRRVFDDEKVQYFLIGYYAAAHNGVVRWIWKRLKIEKATPA